MNSALTKSLYIGRADPAPASNRSWYDGFIDEVRVYNRVLSPNEVLELYSMVVPSDADNDGIPDWWEEQYRGSVMFEDDFNDGDANGWTNFQRSFHVINGRYVSDGSPLSGVSYGAPMCEGRLQARTWVTQRGAITATKYPAARMHGGWGLVALRQSRHCARLHNASPYEWIWGQPQVGRPGVRGCELRPT